MSQQRRRYPGLNYFTTEQKDQFFGRDTEKEDLLALVQTEKIVALFGKSGYGKSSLIRAGLIPILPPNVLPIIINFGAYQKGQSVSLLQKTVDNLNLALPENAAEMDFLNAQSEAVTQSHRLTAPTLWHHFKQKQSTAPRPFLLIFDQFEEFDSYPPEQRAAFKQQLAELLYTRIPQALRDRSDALTDEQQALLARPLEVRALFAIREDRLSVLDALADRLPEILYKRFHLRGLADVQAQAAIIEPALLTGEQFESPRFRYTPEAVAAILRGLKKDDSEALVESFLLQICCEEIERSVIAGREAEPTVTAAQLPVFRDLFEQYYRNKIAALPDEAARRAARRMIEDHLVAADPATGIAYRVNVDGRTLLALPGVDDTLLRRLTDAFLLRSEPNTTGGFSYEVSHDRLVEGILILKKEYEAEEAERLRLEAIAAEEARIAAEKADAERRRRRALVTALVAGVLILGAVVATVFALQKTREATVQAENARLATAEAERQKQAAEEAKKQAKANEGKAKQAETAAQAAKRKAYELSEKAKVDEKNAAVLKGQAKALLEASKLLAVSKLPENFDALILLDSLVCWGWDLNSVSSEVGKLRNLSKLDFSNNQLTDLPTEIGELKNLTTLDLRSNKLTALPTEIGGLKNLTKLSLSSNRLATLPTQIGRLKNLTTLDLYDNQLTSLPPEIRELKNLTTLTLSRNQLTTLPAEIGELKNLYLGDLNSNKLTVLPATIGELKNLTYLFLYDNQLGALPAKIGELKNLSTLGLGGNRLVALPTEIGELKNLTYLNLRNNKLTALPAEIGELKNLTTLDLRDNQLTTLPAEIGELKSLTSLYLDENPIPESERERIRRMVPVGCKVLFE